MAEPSPPLPKGEGKKVDLEIKEHQASDGYRWKYRHYYTTVEPRGIVVFIHGIQSHANWYAQSNSRLAQEGYHVYFLDRRGAGMNGQDRGDAPSFRRLLDDIAEFVRDKPRPLVVMGISWGGKLAVALERRHPGLVDGVVLVCPGIFSRVRPS